MLRRSHRGVLPGRPVSVPVVSFAPSPGDPLLANPLFAEDSLDGFGFVRRDRRSDPVADVEHQIPPPALPYNGFRLVTAGHGAVLTSRASVAQVVLAIVIDSFWVATLAK